MKFLVVLSSLLACSLGQQIQVYSSPYLGSSYPYLGSPYPYLGSPYPYLGAPVVSAPIVAPVSSQFRAQDELGQFTFATSGDNQARVETGALDGSVLGAYSYVDPTGKAVRVHYQADDGGFRVIGANNLPEAVAAPEVAPLKGPEPVQDTPEVVAARAEFQKKYDEAASAAEKSPDTPVSRRRRQILLAAPQVLSVAPAVAKATVKVHQYEPVDAAVPADTNKIELKEREHEVLVPAPVAYAAPQVVSVAHAPQVISVVPAGPQVLSIAPAVAKATVKVHQYEPVDAAVPADTNKIELKEREHEVLVPAPVAYAAPQVVSVAHAPQVISVVPAGPQVLSVAPAVAKATVKVHQYEPVDAAVPADTNKIELKEREHEVLVPAPVSLPLPLVHHAGGLVIG